MELPMDAEKTIVAMPAKAHSSRVYYRVCCFVLFFVAASASLSGYYQKWHFAEADVAGDDSWASIEGMLDGTAHRPSVYRQLLPTTADWLDRVVPEKTKDWLDGQQSGDEGTSGYTISAISASATANDPRYAFRYVVIYGETFLFSLLAVYAMYLVCVALEVARPGAVFAPVILILLLPYLMARGGFFYDYPELALFALAVWVALRFRWWWLIPIVALGTWNKETFLLFIATLYPLLRRSGTRVETALRVGALGVVSAGVLVPTLLRFAHNAGGGGGTWWRGQLDFLLSGRTLLFATEETYGVRMLSAYTVLPMALLVWTAVRGWKDLPPVMQQQARIAAAINIPLYIIFCNPGEMRNLSMLYLALLLVIAANVNRLCWPALPGSAVAR
jgi:hypothetical protein